MRNYFNYFTEIEEHFIRKRRKNLLISPLDWCLIELWRDQGIPLHVVLRGIDRSFEAAEKRHKRGPSTLFYCHPAVLEAFEEYSQAMVGIDSSSQQSCGPASGLADESVCEYLKDLENRLREQENEAFQRAVRHVASLRSEVERTRVDHRELDRELAETGEVLARTLEKELEPDRIRRLRKEVKQEMKIYKKHVSSEVYERLERNYLNRRILDLYGLPEFSLLGLER